MRDSINENAIRRKITSTTKRARQPPSIVPTGGVSRATSLRLPGKRPAREAALSISSILAARMSRAKGGLSVGSPRGSSGTLRSPPPHGDGPVRRGGDSGPAEGRALGVLVVRGGGGA